MTKIETTGKGSLKLPSKTSLERQGVHVECVHVELSTLDTVTLDTFRGERVIPRLKRAHSSHRNY